MWLVSAVFGCCFALEKDVLLTGGPYYYSSWSKFDIPTRPLGRLSRTELAALRRAGYAYHEAYYDEFGRLSLFKKYLNDQVYRTNRYFYRPDGTLYKRITEFDHGEVRIQFFDTSGRLILPED